jgi:asparagine synthase (glutamine-hydrolysing)
MCGIFGWFGSPPEKPLELGETVSLLLRHRGPNDRGFEQGPGWGLGFRRLSILDLTDLGHQPMQCPDRRFWIVFNGEIYNFKELREKLERQGETFRSTSDSEVLLRMLAREGLHCLERLNGMFALALVDTVERTFLLVRDRLGQKPLYYSVQPGHLRFASELKGLLAWADAPRRINLQALVQYLSLGYLSSEACIFQGIQKLPPGHFLTGSLDGPEQVSPSPYWHLELNGQAGEDRFAEGDLEDLIDLLSNAVKIRLRSDVPVGVFLSGGIDSGLVAALAAKAEIGERPLALTVGFAEKSFDETKMAKATGSHVNLEHKIIPQRPGGLHDIDRLAWFYDEPFGDASALPTMNLCEVASAHATVFLSGDGGDEAFGGYRRYVETQRYSWIGKLPTQVQAGMRWLSQYLSIDSTLGYRLLKSSLPDTGLAAVFDGEGLVEDPALKIVLPPDAKQSAITADESIWKRWSHSRGQSILARQQALDYALYLPDDILVKVDRASMAHSIEVRSPFLDYRLVEWAARLPRATLMDANMGKLPLRAAGKLLLPPTVQRGAKRGFGIPLGEWFREPAGSEFVRARLLSPEAEGRGLWDIKGVRKLLTAHQAGRGRSFGELLWRLLMLDAWARHYLDGTGFLQGPPRRKES